MSDYTPDELAAARPPIDSLISKSEKARTKLAAGTWQHTMMGDNVRALRAATAIMDADTPAIASLTRDDLQAALLALSSMIARTEDAQAKFSAGTSQHSLARNRLTALRIAEALIRAQLDAL